jgi:hypothetical protein
MQKTPLSPFATYTAPDFSRYSPHCEIKGSGHYDHNSVGHDKAAQTNLRRDHDTTPRSLLPYGRGKLEFPSKLHSWFDSQAEACVFDAPKSKNLVDPSTTPRFLPATDLEQETGQSHQTNNEKESNTTTRQRATSQRSNMTVESDGPHTPPKPLLDDVMKKLRIRDGDSSSEADDADHKMPAMDVVGESGEDKEVEEMFHYDTGPDLKDAATKRDEKDGRGGRKC